MKKRFFAFCLMTLMLLILNGCSDNRITGTYVESFTCGYLSYDQRPMPYALYLISNEEELEYAEKYIGMTIPENGKESFSGHKEISESFQKIKIEYPIKDYYYLFCYSEYREGDHYHHADAVLFDENKLRFHFDKEKKPTGDSVEQIVGGDFDIAAIPKDFFEGKTITNVISPMQHASYDIDSIIYSDPLFIQIIEGHEIPEKVIYGMGGEGGYEEYTSSDTGVINGFIEALRSISIKSIITDPEQISYTADGIKDFTFVLEDGRKVIFNLDTFSRIHINEVVYELNNTMELVEMCQQIQNQDIQGNHSMDDKDEKIFILERPDTNLEFWITENVDNVDFSKYQERYGLMGGTEYYGSGYVPSIDEEGNQLDPEACVLYTVTSYPDYSSQTRHITSIYITDPSINVYGLTVNSTKDEVKSVIESNGFTYQDHGGTNGVLYVKDKVSFFFMEKLFIHIRVEVENENQLVF